ncbi:MAG: tripartite tricarboxylate transporter permease [Paracoccus sp. (in: a-proteobacteria)]|uniref:tripartite tricarboxylate transporter permease n=1 Tax=Paracoccus sp. TaxID=267 RepID=UPI0039E58329
MDTLLQNIATGAATAFTPSNILYCALGVTIGNFVGVLPGIGALAAISMLFPLTFYLDPATALIFLGGIWYGTAYGGSTASILLNLPGSPSSAVTCLDGYPMARQGRAGVALYMTAVASFVGASIGILLMMGLSMPLVSVAKSFRSPEFFTLMILGLISASMVGNASPIRSVTMVVLGVMLGLIGTDMYTGDERYVFGIDRLSDGLSLVALAMGLFGVSEIIMNSEETGRIPVGRAPTLREMIPSRAEVRQSIGPTLRGSLIGSFFGVMPGVGASVASFLSYSLERKVAKDPGRFGNGAIEGVVAPEAANNAADQTAFIPTLALGIPGSATMALMLGVLLIHGITPGPQVIEQHPEVFWGLIFSFWLGNLLLVVLNIPLIGLWVRILSIPQNVLFPAVLVFMCIGVYTISFSTFEVMLMVGIGIFGYILRQLQFPLAPLLLGFVLGPLMEEHFRRSMILSRGSFEIFVTRPISLIFIAATVFIIAMGIRNILRKGRAAR